LNDSLEEKQFLAGGTKKKQTEGAKKTVGFFFFAPSVFLFFAPPARNCPGLSSCVYLTGRRVAE
jgi:hypothetical protein